jgi:hypothetical protein
MLRVIELKEDGKKVITVQVDPKTKEIVHHKMHTTMESFKYMEFMGSVAKTIRKHIEEVSTEALL